MRCEPVCGQDLMRCADAWRHIFELDPQQEGECGHRKDAVAPLGTHHNLVPVLLEELPAPALPANRLTPRGLLLTRQPVGGRQGTHQQGEEDVHAHRPRAFLGRMLQTPWLRVFLESNDSR